MCGYALYGTPAFILYSTGRSGVLKSAFLLLDMGLPFLDFPSNYFTLGVCMCPLMP
jgi:hypothetical protein